MITKARAKEIADLCNTNHIDVITVKNLRDAERAIGQAVYHGKYTVTLLFDYCDSMSKIVERLRASHFEVTIGKSNCQRLIPVLVAWS